MAAADALVTRIRTLPLVAWAWASFAVIVPLAFALNIWQDEAYTLHTTAHGVAYAFAEALRFEQNAPLYFVLLALWRHIGNSIFFLRLFSVLCAAGTLALAPHLCRRYLPRADSTLATIALAWNPFFIWAALEMRVYAMIVLLSALLLLAFYDAFLAENRNRFAPVLYALCAALALYTQYYLAFLIAAQFAALCLYRRERVVTFLLCAGAAVVAFVPMLAIVPGQVQNFRSPFAGPDTVLHSVGVIGSIIAHYVLPLPLAHPKLVYAVLAVAAAAWFVLVRRWFRKSGDALIVIVTALAALLFALVTFAEGVDVLTRHAAALYVPAIFSVFGVLTFLRPDARKRAAIAWFCISLAASSATIAATYRHLAKPGDWQRVVAVLDARERPGEPIAVFEAENALPLAYYYRGPNRIVPVPSAVNFRRYDVNSFVVRSAAQLRATMPRSKRLWLITAGQCSSGSVDFGCAVMERYVAARYRVEYDAQFFQSRLRLLSQP